MTEVCPVNVGVLPGSSGDTLMLTNPDRDAGGHGHGVVRQLVVSTKHQTWSELPSGLTETLFSGNSGDIRSLSRGVHEIQSKICLSYSGNLEMQLRLLTFYYILDRNSVPSLDPECKNCQYYLLPCLHNHQQWLSWDI